MAASIAAGFCSFVETYAAPTQQASATTQPDALWTQPVLQIIDIQRYAPPHEPFRYYLALSDSRSMLWGIVPPGNTLEQLISGGDIEMGACLLVMHYAIVTAANGRRTIVLTQANAVGSTLSLVGAPQVDPEMYKLSSMSLLAKQAQALANASKTRTMIGEIWDSPESFENGSWEILVRVLWKSKLRRVVGAGGGGGSDDQGRGKFVFDCKVVDAAGTACQCVFFGKRMMYDTIEKGGVHHMSNGTVRYGDEVPVPKPVELLFNERSRIIATMEDSELPHHATREVGVAATPFQEVGAMLQGAAINDIVSVRGVIASCPPPAAVATKNGQSMRRTLRIHDCSTSSLSVEITMWNEAAVEVNPTMGSTWCFRDVAVRMFGANKVLSSRHSSEAFEQPTTVNQHLASVAPTQRDTANPQDPPNIQISVDLLETLPGAMTLVKVSDIKLPAVFNACVMCGKKMATQCSQCGGVQSEPKYHVRVLLSDGVSHTWAAGFQVVGEALFQQPSTIFAQHCAVDGNFAQRAVRNMIGSTVLVSLSQPPSGDATLVDLKQVDHGAAAAFLLEELEFRNANMQ